MVSSTSSIKNKNIIFMLIVLASALGQITSDLYLPSLVVIANNFQADYSGAKLTITLYMIGFAISPLIYGPISDGLGRRKPLMLGLFLCLCGSLICMNAQSIHVLFIGRLLQGLGTGAGSSLIRPILRDLFSKEQLAVYGSYAAIISVAALAFSPLLGGYIQHYFGWRANFSFIFFMTLMLFLSIGAIVPETNRHLLPENLSWRNVKNNMMTLLSSVTFVGYSMLNFLAYGALLAWLTSGSILLQHTVGLTPVEYGWAYALTGLAFSLGAFFNIKCVERLGSDYLLRIGVWCLTVAGLSMLGFRVAGYMNVFVILAPTMILLFAAPLIFNNAFAKAFQPFPYIAGMAGALFSTISTLGGAITSSILAIMPSDSQYPMALTICLCAILAHLIFSIVHTYEKANPTSM